MIVTGQAHLAAPASELWSALSDPRRLGQSLPNVESVDVLDDDRFTATVRPHTNLGQTAMVMDFEIADRRDGRHVRIDGSGGRGENLVELSLVLDLSEADGQTDAVWSADVQVRGVLASLVQRALPALVTEQVDEVLRAGLGLSAA